MCSEEMDSWLVFQGWSWAGGRIDLSNNKTLPLLDLDITKGNYMDMSYRKRAIRWCGR